METCHVNNDMHNFKLILYLRIPVPLSCYIDGLGHKPSNSEFKIKKIHKMTPDQVLHHVQI